MSTDETNEIDEVRNMHASRLQAIDEPLTVQELELGIDKMREINAGRLKRTNELISLDLPDVGRLRQATDMIWVWGYELWRKVRGHKRNHSASFCPHPHRQYRWYAEDGCWGEVCDWCHLIDIWCPTHAHDVDFMRITPPGDPHSVQDGILQLRDLRAEPN
jgi:hypothetical protein